MAETSARWLDRLTAANRAFRQGLDPGRLPIVRTPGRFALITCMDPRVNPAALGLEPFAADGSCGTDVRVIRTIGGLAEERSLIVALHLAGVRELAFVTHSDCGNALAKARVGAITESLARHMEGAALADFRTETGEPFEACLVERLMAFDDPRAAVRREVARVRQLPYVPAETVLHGLTYDLASAALEVVVDGYKGKA